MQTGVLTGALVRWVGLVLTVLLISAVSLAAPGQLGSETLDVQPIAAQLPAGAPLSPFGGGKEERRLLQLYIHSLLRNDQQGPEINSREQEVFFLFGLYDFDRSGFLDGLELMKLLSDYNKHHLVEVDTTQVVAMVDFLLQARDGNRDGLLDPSELVSAAPIHTQTFEIPQQEHRRVEENRPTADDTLDESERAEEHKEEEKTKEDTESQGEDSLQQEVQTEKDIQQTDDLDEQKAPEEAEKEQQHIPPHQGQPEV